MQHRSRWQNLSCLLWCHNRSFWIPTRNVLKMTQSAQNLAEGWEPERCSSSPATTQARGNSTSWARGEQGKNLQLWVTFPSPGLVLRQRDTAMLHPGSVSPLGLDPAVQAHCTYSVGIRKCGFLLNIIKNTHLCLKGRMFILAIFFLYVLCIVCLQYSSCRGLQASLGTRHCYWVLPTFNLSVMLAMVAQVPLSVTGMKPFFF